MAVEMLAGAYFEAVERLLGRLKAEQMANILVAAEMVAEVIEGGKSVFVFGCGHSSILMIEVFHRAGGLMLVNPIFASGLSFGNWSANFSAQLERLAGYGKVIMDDTAIEAGDLLIIISNSGRNAVPVDMALEARERGAAVIGLTSLEYSKSVESRHSSGSACLSWWIWLLIIVRRLAMRFWGWKVLCQK